MVFDVFPYFIDNKLQPREYHFAFLPIDEPHEKGRLKKSLLISSGNKIRFNRDESEITILNKDGDGEIKITSRLEDEDKRRMEKFRKDYFGNMELVPFRMSLQSDLDSSYNKALRAFHKKT